MPLELDQPHVARSSPPIRCRAAWTSAQVDDRVFLEQLQHGPVRAHRERPRARTEASRTWANGRRWRAPPWHALREVPRPPVGVASRWPGLPTPHALHLRRQQRLRHEPPVHAAAAARRRQALAVRGGSPGPARLHVARRHASPSAASSARAISRPSARRAPRSSRARAACTSRPTARSSACSRRYATARGRATLWCSHPSRWQGRRAAAGSWPVTVARRTGIVWRRAGGWPAPA